MEKEFELTDQLRMQLLGALHVGHLKPGSKLPSIREVAERNNVDHRLAARAYTRLEEERLVEIRGRSGVYVAHALNTESQILDDRTRWVASLLRDGWARRTTLSELFHVMRRATLHQLRCVCVESTEDHLVAVTSELAGDFGFSVVPICFKPCASGKLAGADEMRIESEIRAADVLVSTVFHSTLLRPIAERTRKPLIAISINPAMRDEIARHIRGGPLRVVVSDPAFLARGAAFLRQIDGNGHVDLILARDYKRMPAGEIPTLFTKAARRELGLAEFHLVSGDIPFISAESAQDISETIVRLSCLPAAARSNDD